jgi:hypothetical protein
VDNLSHLSFLLSVRDDDVWDIASADQLGYFLPIDSVTPPLLNSAPATVCPLLIADFISVLSGTAGGCRL